MKTGEIADISREVPHLRNKVQIKQKIQLWKVVLRQLEYLLTLFLEY